MVACVVGKTLAGWSSVRSLERRVFLGDDLTLLCIYQVITRPAFAIKGSTEGYRIFPKSTLYRVLLRYYVLTERQTEPDHLAPGRDSHVMEHFQSSRVHVWYCSVRVDAHKG